MTSFNWNCPYCNRAQTVTKSAIGSFEAAFWLDAVGVEGRMGVHGTAIVCSNTECLHTTVSLEVVPYVKNSYNGDLIHRQNEPAFVSRRVMPEGSAKPQPDYIPKAIRDDYYEACLIRDLSPKASATLARRCLQGMIRDFAKPKTKTDKLFDEIKALEKAIADGTAPREISSASVEAMTAVRKVGNIGAHMEADVDVIVEVDSGEAQVLINLIEALLQDWYVEREKRKSLFGSTIALAAEKKQQLTDARVGQVALPSPIQSLEQPDDKPVA